MLEVCGRGSLARVDDQQEESMPASRRDHRPSNARGQARRRRQPAPVGQLERRVPQVDGDAAALSSVSGPCPFRSTPAPATSSRGRCYRGARPSASSRFTDGSATWSDLVVAVSVRQSSSVRPSRRLRSRARSPRTKGLGEPSSTAHCCAPTRRAGALLLRRARPSPPPRRPRAPRAVPRAFAPSRPARGAASIGIRIPAGGIEREVSVPSSARESACPRVARAAG